jgi:hypothetical protein
MAEILIKAVSAVHPDAAKDARASYKRGMPVVVMPDGHVWGTEEKLPAFVVLKLPGVPVSKVEKYLEMDDEPDGTTDHEGNQRMRTVRRRRWKFILDGMPAAARNKLAAQGALVIGPSGDYTWAQVRNFLQNQRTGKSETEDM